MIAPRDEDPGVGQGTRHAATIDGVVLTDIDHEIRELVGACSAMGEQTPAPSIARLGLLLAELTRILPQIETADSRQYFQLLESTVRGALAALAMRKRHECAGE